MSNTTKVDPPISRKYQDITITANERVGRDRQMIQIAACAHFIDLCGYTEDYTKMVKRNREVERELLAKIEESRLIFSQFRLSEDEVMKLLPQNMPLYQPDKNIIAWWKQMRNDYG